jgi:hypothetical protein
LRLAPSDTVTFEFTSLPTTVTVISYGIDTGITPPCLPYADPFCGPPIIPDDPIGTSTLPNQGLVLVGFGNDLLDAGETLTLDLYENSASELPFASQSFTGTGISSITTGRLGLWQNLQGIVRITMNEGSVNLDYLGFEVVQNGVGYVGTTTVPEPSTLAIGLVAGVIALWFGVRRRSPRIEA